MVQMSVCGTVRLEKGPREEAAERKEPGNLFDHHRRRSPKYPSLFKFCNVAYITFAIYI